MVSESDLLIKLIKQLANFDDAAFEALANKGLLRRAGKDLQNGLTPEILQATATEVEFRVGDANVKMDQQGPVKATCTCPAIDVCRHILIACLWLQQQPVNTTDSASTEAATLTENESSSSTICVELLEYTLDEITKWAGKKTVRSAQEKLLRANTEIQHDGAIIVQFPDFNAICRYFPGSGLAGMICSCRAATVCFHLVGAVFNYQRAHGVEIIFPFDKQIKTEEALVASSEAPRTREEVLVVAKNFLVELITVGICHLSDASQQRAATLAVSATGVALPRLSLLLRSIADDLALVLKRSAGADNERLFLTLARGYALITALQQQEQIELIGRTRTSYEDIGTLELAGLGAYQWQTRSGYRGLTVYFWELKSQQWYSWTEARPAFHQSDFNPQMRYLQDGPWVGVRNPAQAATYIVKLQHAHRNYQNRLSSTARSQAIIAGASIPAQLNLSKRCFNNWQQLREYTRSISVVGLAEFDPLKEMVVIQPAVWGERDFIETTQLFYWAVFDQDADYLSIKVPYSAANKAAIAKLEKLDPKDVYGLLVRVNSSDEHLSVYPISLLLRTATGPAVISLTVDHEFKDLQSQPPADSNGQESQLTEEELEQESEETGNAPVFSGKVFQMVEGLISQLQKLAERGNGLFSHDESRLFAAYAAEFEMIGLKALKVNLKALAGSGRDLSEMILRVRYICQVVLELKQRIN